LLKYEHPESRRAGISVVALLLLALTPVSVVAEDAIPPTSTPVKQETVQRAHRALREKSSAANCERDQERQATRPFQTVAYRTGQ
jgi:hypothetical protein